MKVLKYVAVFSLVAMMASGAAARDLFTEYDVVHDTNGNIVMNTHEHCVHTNSKSGLAECDVKAPQPAPAPARMEPRPEPRMYK